MSTEGTKAQDSWSASYKAAYEQGFEQGRQVSVRGFALFMLMQRFKNLPFEVMAGIYYGEISAVEALLPHILTYSVTEIWNYLGVSQLLYPPPPDIDARSQ